MINVQEKKLQVFPQQRRGYMVFKATYYRSLVIFIIKHLLCIRSKGDSNVGSYLPVYLRAYRNDTRCRNAIKELVSGCESRIIDCNYVNIRNSTRLIIHCVVTRGGHKYRLG